jgi:hypothetical protein
MNVGLNPGRVAHRSQKGPNLILSVGSSALLYHQFCKATDDPGQG